MSVSDGMIFGLESGPLRTLATAILTDATRLLSLPCGQYAALLTTCSRFISISPNPLYRIRMIDKVTEVGEFAASGLRAKQCVSRIPNIL
jgi:hypothetical protein